MLGINKFVFKDFLKVNSSYKDLKGGKAAFIKLWGNWPKPILGGRTIGIPNTANGLELLGLLLIVSFGYVSASNSTFDGEASKIYSSYDDASEKLELKYSLFLDGEAMSDLNINMTIGNKTCTSKLEYKSFTLQGGCSIPVKKDEIKGLYKLFFEIKQGDENVYSSLYEVTLKEYNTNSFWKNLKLVASHDGKKGKLKLHVYIEGDVGELYEGHEVSLGNIVEETWVDMNGGGFYYPLERPYFEQKHSRILKYDKNEKKLYFDIEIGQLWTLPQYMNYKYKIYNDSKKEVFSGKTVFPTSGNKSLEYDWEKLKSVNYYDEKERKVFIKFFLDGIKENPNVAYEMLVGHYGNSKLSYDDLKNEIYTIIDIRRTANSGIKRYDIEYSIKELGGNVFFSGKDRVRIDFDRVNFDKDKDEGLKKHSLGTKQQPEIKKDKVEVEKKVVEKESKYTRVAKKYVANLEKKLQDKEKVNEQIERLVMLLEKHKEKKPKYAKIIDQLVIEFTLLLNQ